LSLDQVAFSLLIEVTVSCYQPLRHNANSQNLGLYLLIFQLNTHFYRSVFIIKHFNAEIIGKTYFEISIVMNVFFMPLSHVTEWTYS